jgi:hypothetical protein
MKSSYLRASTALACALGLSACGGSSGSFQIGGTVSGLTDEGELVLQNNGGPDLPIKGNATGAPVRFGFPNLVDVDSSYSVKAKSWPKNVEKCDIPNGTGRASFNVSNIVVTCTLKKHVLSGSINGLGMDARGLVVVNGPDRGTIKATGSALIFEMPQVGEGQAYGITTIPPDGFACTVTKGVGRMTADVTNVVIDCGPKPSGV